MIPETEILTQNCSYRTFSATSLNESAQERSMRKGKEKSAALDEPAAEGRAYFQRGGVNRQHIRMTMNLTRWQFNQRQIELHPARHVRNEFGQNDVLCRLIDRQRASAKTVTTVAVFRSRRNRIPSIASWQFTTTTRCHFLSGTCQTPSQNTLEWAQHHQCDKQDRDVLSLEQRKISLNLSTGTP